MKKYAAIIAGFTAILLLTQTNLSNDLLFFFLVGAIPGTTKSVSPYVMLTAIIIASWTVVFSFPAVRQLSVQLFIYLRNTVSGLVTQYTNRRLGDA